jgi:hypothetical protein
MKLIVKWHDMRGGYGSPASWQTPVIDEDTGRDVGYVHEQRSPAERYISLFGGKYQGGAFTRPEECAAFAEGVEAVLNHMTDLTEQAQQSGEAT